MGRKITALKAQKRNRERVNVYLDGEFAFGLARIVAGWLQVGQELSEDKIASLQAEDQHEAAYQQALRFIQYRDRSEAEVTKNLKEHAVPDEVADVVIERLRRGGLVNDERFARLWVDNRSEFRPRSRRALAYELKQRGLDGEAIQAALSSIDDEELAYQAALKQQQKLKNLEWPEFRHKLYGFLSRRGFNYEISAAAVARVWSELHVQDSTDGVSSDEEVG